MIINGIEIKKITENLWEIPKQGKMLVPARLYSSKKMIDECMQGGDSLKQLINVAELPGIQKWSLAMPDIHWGYGFPIGGVAAFDVNDGIISPGGVGYDINCGVRLIRTSLQKNEIEKKLKKLVDALFNKIPTGVGSSDAIKKLSLKEIKKVALQGSEWAVKNGFGRENDLYATEDEGKMKNADPDIISERAYKRGETQLGTLGSGNHFLEIDVVEKIYDEETAQKLGLFKNQIVVMIHTGSRGFGYQVCDDFLRKLRGVPEKYGIIPADRQLMCAPFASPEGREYYNAMASAANFAWANRQIIMSLSEKVFTKVLGVSGPGLGFSLVYDVAHNIAKVEEHNVDGKIKKVVVHRKGATRSFPKGHPDLSSAYKNIGQPVLIPGDMGRYSYIAVGAPGSMTDTFGSTCHGAGRVKGRKQAVRESLDMDVFKEVSKYGIVVRAKGRKSLAEEMPFVYKDVANVVDVMDKERISLKVAKLKPLGVIKG
ncbi:MAG: RtcB family protein [Calditrichia bacterium]|nr:RtcB family protein [Calditrichia bacterium]